MQFEEWTQCVLLPQVPQCRCGSSQLSINQPNVPSTVTVTCGGCGRHLHSAPDPMLRGAPRPDARHLAVGARNILLPWGWSDMEPPEPQPDRMTFERGDHVLVLWVQHLDRLDWTLYQKVKERGRRDPINGYIGDEQPEILLAMHIEDFDGTNGKLVRTFDHCNAPVLLIGTADEVILRAANELNTI